MSGFRSENDDFPYQTPMRPKEAAAQSARRRILIEADEELFVVIWDMHWGYADLDRPSYPCPKIYLSTVSIYSIYSIYLLYLSIYLSIYSHSPGHDGTPYMTGACCTCTAGGKCLCPRH